MRRETCTSTASAAPAQADVYFCAIPTVQSPLATCLQSGPTHANCDVKNCQGLNLEVCI